METALVLLTIGGALDLLTFHLLRTPEATMRKITSALSRGRREDAGRADQTRVMAVLVGAMGMVLTALGLWWTGALWLPWLRLDG